MIANLDEMKAFLQWCRDTGIVAVKFSEGPESRDASLIPVDVVFSGSPPDAGTIASGGPIKHSPYKEGDEIKADGVTYEEGEEFTKEDLYGPTG